MAILSYLFFPVLVSFFLNSISCHGALYVFGDSLFDPGNNRYFTKGFARGPPYVPPYGETFFGYPTGRFSDGRILPDFIAQFANLPKVTPYLEPSKHQFTDGANFASGGAGVLAEINPWSISLPVQFNYFKTGLSKLGVVKAKEVLKRAVLLFSIGSNDYLDVYYRNRNVTHPQSFRRRYVGTIIGNLTSILEEIYSLGGRNFAFQNVYPLGCAPFFKNLEPEIGSGCLEEPTALPRLHNKALAKSLQNLESKLPGFKYSIFDLYNAQRNRINNPTKYGFKIGKASCCGVGAYRGQHCGDKNSGYKLCGNPSNHVFWDGAHNTEEANHQYAVLMWSGTPNVVGPYNVKQLFDSL